MIDVTSDGCWEWVGPTSRNGYGTFSVRYAKFRAHRWSYERFIGPIQEGLVIDHLCRNTLCVNPYHLEPVTNLENLRRAGNPIAFERDKTHCKHGHPFDEENTRIERDGKRGCRACDREYQRRKHGSVSWEEFVAQFRSRTHCVKGHEWDDENIYVNPKTGDRRCRACQRERNRKKNNLPPEKWRHVPKEVDVLRSSR